MKHSTLGSRQFLSIFKKVSSSTLLDQYYLNIKSSLAPIVRESLDKHNIPVFDRIYEILNGRKCWTLAREAEQLLINLFSKSELEIELQIRLEEAVKILPKETVKLYRSLAANPKNDIRVILKNLMCDLHWRLEKKYIRMAYGSVINIKVGFMFTVFIAFFFGPDLFASFYNEYLGIVINSRKEFILTAINSGILGSLFSLLSSLSKKLKDANLEELRLMKTWGFVLFRATVGCGAGMIMFYLLSSGLLQGTVFPPVDFSSEVIEGQGKSLLILWCFIAGFSERFVPNVLTSTAEKTVQTVQPTEEKSS